LSEICNDLILAQTMPLGAVHTNSDRRAEEVTLDEVEQILV